MFWKICEISGEQFKNNSLNSLSHTLCPSANEVYWAFTRLFLKYEAAPPRINTIYFSKKRVLSLSVIWELFKVRLANNKFGEISAAVKSNKWIYISSINKIGNTIDILRLSLHCLREVKSLNIWGSICLEKRQIRISLYPTETEYGPNE